MSRRVQIDRLELDLRGIAPATAEAAARLLGPALARALSGGRLASPPAGHVDAGRIETAPGSAPRALATQIARHISGRLTGERS